MQHLKREMREILDEAVETVADFDDATPVETRRGDIREALSAWRPTVMFYGLYNAGKSTLLNALLSERGEEIAETSARPCTSCIEEYELGDYVVFDTPGLDAPQEHEELSRRQLEKSHVVVFVVSTEGAFDERQTIEELARLWRSDRPVIVVLNDKTGGDRPSDHILEKREQMLSNLAETTGDESVRQELDFMLVDASAGVRARRQMAEAESDRERRKARILYDHSGVELLAEVVVQRLVDFKGEQLLVPARTMLEDALDDTLDDMRNGLDDEAEARFFTNLRKTLSAIERDFLDASELAVKALRNSLIEDLTSGIRAEEVSLEELVDSYADKVTEIVENEAQKAHRRAGEEVVIVDAEFDGDEPGADPQVEVEDIGDAEVTGEEQTFGASMEGLSPRQRRRLAAQLSTYFQSQQGQKTIKQGLLKLRNLNVPGMKGRWEQTLSQWAGKIGKGLGMGIQALALGFEIHQAKEAQKKHEQKVKQRQRDIQNTSEKIARRAERNAVYELPEIADQLFSPFYEFIADIRADIQDDEECRQRAIDKLEALRSRLDAVNLQTN